MLDNEAYFKHFDPNRFVALNADGTVVHSFDEFKKNYLQGVQGLSGYEELKFDKVKISVIDNKNALLVNEYSASLRLRDGQTVSVKGAGTQVWHKMDSEWKLVSVSSSTYSK